MCVYLVLVAKYNQTCLFGRKKTTLKQMSGGLVARFRLGEIIHVVFCFVKDLFMVKMIYVM